ncbi:MAG: cytochrome P450, partial [Acidobacteria bacterium]|nr:cytochrome P450 [Acidobacteriota bacterium]
HRHPAYFRDPERFDPERWLGETAKKLSRFVYFPFGGGPRQCIGASFAMMESVLLLATAAQHFRLRILPDHPVRPVPSFTLRPKYGIRMRFESRRPSTPRHPGGSPVIDEGAEGKPTFPCTSRDNRCPA